MAIQATLFDEFKAKLQKVLLQTLKPSGSDAEERCREWLREPGDIVDKRNELTSRQARLKVDCLSFR